MLVGWVRVVWCGFGEGYEVMVFGSLLKAMYFILFESVCFDIFSLTVVVLSAAY
jgi:hypothetical protein